MSSDADLVLSSLQRVADAVEDPAPAVYGRLFAGHPELEELFALDPQGAVRRNMLNVALETLMDHVEGRAASTNMVLSERTSHSHLGVSRAVFDDFYLVIRDAFAELVGPQWSADTQRAWTDAIAALVAPDGFDRQPPPAPPRGSS